MAVDLQSWRSQAVLSVEEVSRLLQVTAATIEARLADELGRTWGGARRLLTPASIKRLDAELKGAGKPEVREQQHEQRSAERAPLSKAELYDSARRFALERAALLPARTAELAPSREKRETQAEAGTSVGAANCNPSDAKARCQSGQYSAYETCRALNITLPMLRWLTRVKLLTPGWSWEGLPGFSERAIRRAQTDWRVNRILGEIPHIRRLLREARWLNGGWDAPAEEPERAGAGRAICARADCVRAYGGEEGNGGTQ